MKRITLLLFICLISKCYSQQSNTPLFKIVENNKIGYIDSTGKVIIKPQFRNAGDFSEGLAYARTNGTYGYINQKGDYVIQPQFDFAIDFKEGIGYVMQDEKPFYIDRQGQKLFDFNFLAISAFENGRSRVRTRTEKLGYIGKQGKFVVDTLFKTINPFISGLAVVRGLNHQESDDEEKGIKKNYEVGVIDTTGKFIVPYGKFESINDLKNGYFKVEIPAEPWDTLDGYSKQTGFVDRTGQLVLARDGSNHCRIEGDIHCGLAKMSLYQYWIPETKESDFSYDKLYGGYINLKGEIAINDTTFDTVEDFSENRAFVKSKDYKYSLIDTKGIVLAEKAYSLIKSGFKNGKTFVEGEDGWGLIDTTGNFILKPMFEEITTGEIIDDYFFFEEENANGKDNYRTYVGVAKIDGTILVEPIMEQVDVTGFHHGLLQCFIDEKLTYINQKGEIIWQAKKYKTPEKLNIDFMNRGHFYATSERNKNDLGGFGGSDNRPKLIDKSHSFPDNSLSILVQTDKKGERITVFVSNTTNEKIDFNAQDSRLYMKAQALDKKGVWRDIEYLPSSWCGNSYHTLSLKSNQYWEFNSPVYEGDFQTKLRIELKYFDPNDKSNKGRNRNEKVLYSNEYEGSVNPGQFWRKVEYSPGGIMDPYFD